MEREAHRDERALPSSRSVAAQRYPALRAMAPSRVTACSAATAAARACLSIVEHTTATPCFVSSCSCGGCRGPAPRATPPHPAAGPRTSPAPPTGRPADPHQVPQHLCTAVRVAQGAPRPALMRPRPQRVRVPACPRRARRPGSLRMVRVMLKKRIALAHEEILPDVHYRRVTAAQAP